MYKSRSENFLKIHHKNSCSGVLLYKVAGFEASNFTGLRRTPQRKLSCEFYKFFQYCFSVELLLTAASKSLWNMWTLAFVLFFFWKENITLKNYLIMFERVDKLSRKIYSYLRKILDLNLKVFGLWILMHYILLDFDW